MTVGVTVIYSFIVSYIIFKRIDLAMKVMVTGKDGRPWAG
jgi:ammonia channel protein AmtB